jgi:YD repeat-containing protein
VPYRRTAENVSVFATDDEAHPATAEAEGRFIMRVPADRRQRSAAFLVPHPVRQVVAVILATAVADLAGVVVVTPATAQTKVSGAQPLPGLASPAPAAPARDAPAFTDDVRNIPPHPSQLATARPAPRPSTFDPARSTVVESETTATRKVFRNPADGTLTAELSPRPVRFKDSSGKWVEIDPTLGVASDGVLRPKAVPSGIRLAATTGATEAVVETAAGPVGLRHPGASPAAAATKGAEATYKGAVGGRDLVLGATASGVEETAVLADAKAGAAYLSELVLPAGVNARNVPGGVELVDANGAVVALYANGVAMDAGTRTRPAALTQVDVELLGLSPAPEPSAADVLGRDLGSAQVALVRVGVDPAWLGAPGRAFPLRIDPLLTRTFSTAGSGFDTFVWNQNPTTSYATNPNLGMGTNNGGTDVLRALLSFDVSSVAAANVWVTDAKVSVNNWYSSSGCTTTPSGVSLFPVEAGVGTPIGAGTTWANQPAVAAAPVATRSFAHHNALGTTCAPAYENFDVTALARGWLNGSATNLGVELRAASETDSGGFKWFYSAESGSSLAPKLSITYTHQPNEAAPTSPADGAVLTTTRPDLTVQAATDPDGDQVMYWYRVTTSPDAESGPHALDSHFLGVTTYTVPAGALQDGVTYYWHVWTYDGTIWRQPTATPRSFRVDLGLGAQPAQPYDELGPVTVNLASGNPMVSVASRQLDTVGGPMGMTYAYNGGGASPTAGLSAAYYPKPAATDPASFEIGPGEEPVLVRREPMVYAIWGTASPWPSLLEATNYTVRWSGYIDLPAGSYTFGAQSDDGVRVKVNGMVAYERWSDGNTIGGLEVPFGPAPIALPGGRVPIVVDYYQHGGSAGVILVLKDPSPGAPPGGFTFPSSSMLSVDRPALPAGWSSSAALGGVTYLAAQAWDSGVVLLDASGAAHPYTAAGGGYTPPPGEDGVLARDASGRLSLHAEDGLTYVFNADGTLASATSALDDTSPAAPRYTWEPVGSPALARLVAVTDPVGQRSMTLRYGGDAACPSGPAPLAAAPAGMLCEVTYGGWDNASTKLYYNANGQLARIEEPGGADADADRRPRTDFSYDTAGRLAQVRSPLVADAVVAGVISAADAATSRHNTVIGYDASGRVASVTAPAPTVGSDANRPAHSYWYVSATTTQVFVAGIDGAMPGYAGFFRKVTLDAARRLLTDTDATNRTTTYQWDAADRLLAVTDPANRRTTTIYDVEGRPTDTYGPAPASCFGTNRLPNGTCADVGHRSTAYDGGLSGLSATYWDNPDWAGAPRLHRNAAVSGTSPDASLGSTWSARFTGEIDLGATANLRAAGSGTVTLWIDDARVTGTEALAPGRHRVEIDYRPSATPSLALEWRPPGGGFATVPAGWLNPRYGLVTATTTDDATAGSPPVVTAVAYQRPETGLATSATLDPGAQPHLALVTATAYEDPGPGQFFRPLSRTLPAGNATTYAYYPVPASRTSPCGGGTANQGGRLKTTAAPDPDGGGPQAPRVTEVVYDAVGRVVASRVGAEAWSCVTYDLRGRPISRTVPAFGGQPARTVTYDWARPVASSATTRSSPRSPTPPAPSPPPSTCSGASSPTPTPPTTPRPPPTTGPGGWSRPAGPGRCRAPRPSMTRRDGSPPSTSTTPLWEEPATTPAATSPRRTTGTTRRCRPWAATAPGAPRP